MGPDSCRFSSRPPSTKPGLPRVEPEPEGPDSHAAAVRSRPPKGAMDRIAIIRLVIRAEGKRVAHGRSASLQNRTRRAPLVPRVCTKGREFVS